MAVSPPPTANEVEESPTPAQAQMKATLKAKMKGIDYTPPSNRLRNLERDPWLRQATARNPNSGTTSTRQTRVLIIGAGYGGLLFAVRLLQSGFSLDDILLVDSAGGFGGTWYWNRYPGLMCDIESYIYMPLLEETGHIPSRKYVPGEELRGHAEKIAEKWQLQAQTMFQTTITSMSWDENMGRWIATAVRSNGEEKQRSDLLMISADFAIIANGTLSTPKIPDIPGLDDFAGHVFHTARWDYGYTGGSPALPTMDRLKKQRVGVIGTGSTAVQIIPQLARWAGELTVFQRTPGAVGLQENKATDPQSWNQTILDVGPGWQRKRSENFNAFISGSNLAGSETHEKDLVNDGWTRYPSFSAAIGGARNLQPDFLELAKRVDRQRQQAAQEYITATIDSPSTIEALTNRTYGWCKRPCFHERYIETYNLPHVQLVKTPAQGVTDITRTGIRIGDQEYELDLIVLATGYDLGSLCPADRARLTVQGRGGHLMSEKWAAGPATLHGVMTRGFPNLFFPGTSQAGVTANQSYMFDRAAEHVAYIIRHAQSRAQSSCPGCRVRVEPNQQAEELWTAQSIARAGAFAATKTCGAGSYTISSRYGESGETEKLARHMPWGEGMASYVRVLESWRADGRMDGLEIVCE
ncbi:hypothetical protein BJX70DRAFT_377414 [Aspergillus crustosus]